MNYYSAILLEERGPAAAVGERLEGGIAHPIRCHSADDGGSAVKDPSRPDRGPNHLVIRLNHESARAIALRGYDCPKRIVQTPVGVETKDLITARSDDHFSSRLHPKSLPGGNQ